MKSKRISSRLAVAWAGAGGCGPWATAPGPSGVRREPSTSPRWTTASRVRPGSETGPLEHSAAHELRNGQHKAAGGVLTAKQAPAGPAPPRRSVCAPAAMSGHCSADQPGKGEPTMSFYSWLQSLRSALAPGWGQRKHGRGGSLRAARYRPYLEVLEDRCVPAFLAPVDYTVGGGSFDVKAGDFNGDGNPDLATANFYDDTVSVLLGNADGTFQPAQTAAVGPYPRSLAVGDFNNDGNLDLVTTIHAGSGGIDISILLGNGDGTFAAEMQKRLGYYPALYVATGDLNADGKLDLVATLENDLSWAEHVSVLLGRGDGTFTHAATYGPYPYTALSLILLRFPVRD